MVNYAHYIPTSLLTTAGDMLIENATPAAARLAVGSAGQVLGVSAGLPAWGAGMTLLATTGPAGAALVNGTPTILTWTPPNDGGAHRFMLAGHVAVSSLETGGQINLNFSDPGGNAYSRDVMDAGQAAGFHDLFLHGPFMSQAGVAVTVSQQSALTGGAAILYAELWGS